MKLLKTPKQLLLITSLLLISTASFAAPEALVNLLSSSDPSALNSLIQQHSIYYFWIIFFALGVLLAFTPCVLPMVPILSGIISHSGNSSVKSNAKLALAYVLGMAMSYAIAGMLAAVLGASLQSLLQTPLVLSLFAALMVVLSLSMFGVLELRTPQWLGACLPKQKSNKTRGFIGVFIMGAISTLVVSPCVTAPLVGVLTFISQSGQVFLGGSILFIMALGMGLPLIVFAMGQGRFLPKSGIWMVYVRVLFGYMMLLIAAWLLSRILPINLSHDLYLAVGLGWLFHSGYFCAKLTSKQSQWCFSLIVLLLALLSSYPLVNRLASTPNKKTLVTFQAAKTLSALEEKLALAKNNHQPVFLEFYASWCGDCIEMDKTVFSDSEIKKALDKFSRIKVDISLSTRTTRLFKEKYKVFGTPTLIVINKKGELTKAKRAAGLLSKQQFLALIN